MAPYLAGDFMQNHVFFFSIFSGDPHLDTLIKGLY